MEKQLGNKGEKPNGEQEGQSGKEGQKGGEGQQGKTSDQGPKESQSAQAEGLDGDSGELFEIFKKQQELRSALQDLIDQNGLEDKGKGILDSMEKIEQSLINQGVTKKSLQAMQNLKHQLLKLEKALQQQGEDTKRVSNSSKADRVEPPSPSDETIKQYFNTIEILNRQSLPLRQEFKIKVQEYFKTQND